MKDRAEARHTTYSRVDTALWDATRGALGRWCWRMAYDPLDGETHDAISDATNDATHDILGRIARALEAQEDRA